MSFYDALILGILQGLTEFLPVSSSGHLVLAQAILKVKESGVSFEVLVHLGSLLAVIIYFRLRILTLIKSLFNRGMVRERRIVICLVVGTLPAVVAALLFRGFFESAFSNPVMTSVMLFVTGLILVSTAFVGKSTRDIALLSAVAMGVGQALAIMPGISRSGTTIAAGMLAGVKPSEAAEFSFLLAIPAILGAVIFKADTLLEISRALIAPYAVGALVALASSLFAVYAVLAVIRRGKFVYFGYYCFAAGAVGLYLFV
ncbi:MAG: undecaprenyl-diphosphate phosphatase [Candidatus Zixiibacteriota bacterium]|nr:MAG: undecaprenyl-diphosphate phosphatase [candidate division Zixibacteria bacterium]